MGVGRWDVMRAVGARERMYAGSMPLGVAIGVWNVPVLAGNLENRHVLVVWCSRQSRGKSRQVEASRDVLVVFSGAKCG
jgi:hypothetical protein